MRTGTLYMLAICFGLSACTEISRSNKLVGDWKLIHANFETPSLDSLYIIKAKKSLESSNFSFQQDRQFQIVDLSFSGGSYQGIWDFSAGENKLTLYYPDFNIEPDEYDVVRLSRKTLIIRQNIQSVGILEYQLVKMNNE